jgi:23S rRNA pseudouridine1911/1915/1917 synthase
VTVSIGPVPHPRLGTVHAAHAEGRPADSAVTVLERRASTTLCDVAIATGRPHQIRIHLAWAGHPLAGDPLYAPGGLPRPLAPGLPGDGGYLLHAHRVRFAHPATGAPTIIEAPLPEALRCR